MLIFELNSFIAQFFYILIKWTSWKFKVYVYFVNVPLLHLYISTHFSSTYWEKQTFKSNQLSTFKLKLTHRPHLLLIQWNWKPNIKWKLKIVISINFWIDWYFWSRPGQEFLNFPTTVFQHIQPFQERARHHVKHVKEFKPKVTTKFRELPSMKLYTNLQANIKTTVS